MRSKMPTDLIILFTFLFIVIVTQDIHKKQNNPFFVHASAPMGNVGAVGGVGTTGALGPTGPPTQDVHHHHLYDYFQFIQDVIIDPRWENPAFKTFYKNVFYSHHHTLSTLPSEVLHQQKRQSLNCQEECFLEQRSDDLDFVRSAIYIHNERHYPDLPHKSKCSSSDLTTDDNVREYKYILISGESPDPTQNRPTEIMNRTIFIGHHVKTRAKHTFWIPWASFIFNFLETKSPLELIVPRHLVNAVESVDVVGRTDRVQPRKFAAYFASNCVPYREKIYDDLVEFAKKHNLGMVSAFGPCCGSHPETKDTRLARSVHDMYTKNIELQKEFRFVLALENAHKDYYIDQKITIAFLAGAIPIYSGSKNVFDIFNKDAFLWMEPYQSIVDILSPIVLDTMMNSMFPFSKLRNEKELIMLKAPIVTRQGMYYFSWNLNVHNVLKGLDPNKRTLREELWDATGVAPL